MAENKKVDVRFGVSFISLLFLLFLALMKLTDQIDWSWWWVFAPLWAVPALFIGVCALWIGGYLVYETLNWYSKRSRSKRK